MKLLLFIFLLFCSCSMLHKNEPKKLWSSFAKSDIEAIYKIIKENHPGPIDKLNPNFNKWLESGKKESLKLAARARNYEGYKFSVKSYVEGFNDGHLNYWDHYDKWNLKWPNFIVSYRNGSYVVSNSKLSAKDKDSPQDGDTLLSCDGKNLEVLYKKNIYKFRGSPVNDSHKYRLAPYLLVDEENPFIELPKICTFRRSQKTYSHKLNFENIRTHKLYDLTKKAIFGDKPNFSFSMFGDGGLWVTIPTFGPSKKEAKLLKSYIRKLEKIYKKTKYIVFDVRGNSGGSSQWGKDILKVLIGQINLENLDKFLYTDVYIDWRVSKENMKAVSKWPQHFTERFGANHEATKWSILFDKRMKEAYKSRKVVMKQDEKKKTIINKKDRFELDRNINNYNGKIYFLTDGRCGSACLDFSDLILQLPMTTHIGLETASDTVYMEGNVIDPLPSQLGHIYYPMKVWRNRIRANNESYKPEIYWKGDISDTKSLKNWVINLYIKGK